MTQGMPNVGVFTVALIAADHGKGVPTAIIYAASENCDAPQALRDFCVAYGSSKGGVAIVPAYGPALVKAAAAAGEADAEPAECGRVGCVLPAGHVEEAHEDGDGNRVATPSELSAEGQDD